ncbi:hypothetical protein VTL71DRAFT_3878 [Oculimacula yallundae]|uniref:Uncharacterized protein n=1 Tax=Oculimacula yallundae TaxID=86028 RepID=A0ABR4C485_9HELO
MNLDPFTIHNVFDTNPPANQKDISNPNSSILGSCASRFPSRSFTDCRPSPSTQLQPKQLQPPESLHFTDPSPFPSSSRIL